MGSGGYRKATNRKKSSLWILCHQRPMKVQPHHPSNTWMHQQLQKSQRLFSRIFSCLPNIRLCANGRRNSSMAAPINGTEGVPADTSSENKPRKLKILMLHGTLQSWQVPYLLLCFKPTPACRIHSEWAPLPCQNPGPRKAPFQSLPYGLP